MPTLTHQTGRITGTGQAGSASVPDARAGTTSSTDAWPETATSDGSAGRTGSSTERGAGAAGRDVVRPGSESQRSSAGRRLAARAGAEQPQRPGSGPGPGPGSGPNAGQPGSAGQEGAANQPGSPGPGDAGIDPFPDLDIKQPAPRVDATRRDTGSGPQYETRPDDGGRGGGRDRGGRRGAGRDTDGVGRAVEEAFFGQGSDLTAYDAEIDRVVDRLYREVERKMRIERERRGL